MTEEKTRVTITLDRFYCKDSHESKGGGDDLYIKYKIDGLEINYRYPNGNTCGVTDLPKGESWNLDYPITFSKTLVVTLWDQEGLLGGKDDDLGSKTFRPEDNLDQPFSFKTEYSEYHLYAHWE